MNIMRNLDEYLKQLEKKAGITSSTNATRCDSIAELLTSFNNNPHNSEVTDYISRRELSIMAVSDEEKKLLTQFMGDSDNKRLLDIAVNYKLGHKLYSYGSVECMTFDQALENALSDYIKRNGEFKSMKDFRDIYGAQKGGTRFLIYALKETDDKLYYIPTHLFEYNGKAYPSIVNALKVAVKDYISRTGKSTDEVIEDFKVIYERVKWHQHVFKKSGEPIEDMMYLPTDFPNLFIRKQINQDKIIKINEILVSKASLTYFCSQPSSDICARQRQMVFLSSDIVILFLYFVYFLISSKNITCINLVFYIIKARIITIGDDSI